MWPGLTSPRRKTWPMPRSWCSSSPGSRPSKCRASRRRSGFRTYPGSFRSGRCRPSLGLWEGRDASGRAHTGRPGARASPADGPGLAPWDLSRRSDGGVRQEPARGEFEEPGREKGSATDLVHRGEVVGRVVRTRDGVSPVYVSVGNGIDLRSSVELVLACCTRYRLPETTRQAHNAANRLGAGRSLAAPCGCCSAGSE